MTYEQKRLVRYWVVAVIFISLGAYASFSDTENGQVALLILVVIFTFVSSFQDFSYYYSGFGEDSERIGRFVDDHPFLKYWLVFYCMTVLPVIVYRIQTTENDSTSGTLFFLAFLFFLGPIIVISERERFLRLGNE